MITTSAATATAASAATSTSAATSGKAQFTAARIATALWALGDKGGLAARDPGWAAEVSTALAIHLANTPPTFGLAGLGELSKIARRVKNVAEARRAVWPLLTAGFVAGLAEPERWHGNDRRLSAFVTALHAAVGTGLLKVPPTCHPRAIHVSPTCHHVPSLAFPAFG
jgi:hypothetical protein